MKSRILVLSIGSIFLTSLVFFQSCKKINEATQLGGDLIPAVDNVNTFEAFLDVETDNFLLPDSTRIGRTDEMALGVLNDPSFGTTKSEMYFSISSPTYGTYPFKTRNTDSVAVDSIILTTAFTQLYGDSTSVQNLQVFEINQSADFDTAGLHYPISNPDFALAGSLSPVTSVDFTTLNDSKQVLNKIGDTSTIVNQLRIPLFTTIASRFIGYDTTATGAYKNDSLFRTFFKGIAIKVVGGDNKALAYFNLSDSKSGLSFYCKITQNGKVDTTVVTFPVVNGIAANLVKRTVLNPTYAANLGTPPPSVNKPVLYIQSSPGSYATVRVKGLEALSNRVIHRAELQINALPTSDDTLLVKPKLLFLDAIDSLRNIKRTIPIDFAFSQGSYNIQSFGGTFKNNTTFFNITRYVQSIVTRHDSLYTMRIYAPFETIPWFSLPGSAPIYPYSPIFPSLIINTPIAYGRVILGGGSHPDSTKRMRLRIVYSKI